MYIYNIQGRESQNESTNARIELFKESKAADTDKAVLINLWWIQLFWHCFIHVQHLSSWGFGFGKVKNSTSPSKPFRD